MSRIEELILSCCPSGVASKTLGEIGTTFGGLTGKSKQDFSEGNARFVSYMNVFNNIAVDIAADDFVRIGQGERQHRLRLGDVLFTGTSETPDEVAMSSVVTVEPDEPLYLNSFSIGYRLSDPALLDPAFAKHLFRSREIRKQLIRTANGVTRFNVSKSRLANVRIPLPPIEVQREIGRALDSFTELGAELQAELEARRYQCAFYRRQLLTFPEAAGVRTVRMGDLADFKYGFTASAADTGEYRFLRITDITQWGKLSPDGAKFVPASPAAREYVVEPGDLLMARTGATFGKTMLVGSDESAVYASFLIRIRFTEKNVLPAYYWHFAQSELYWSQANALAGTGGQPQFNANALKLVEIPVPPIEEQARIVSILDGFDALTNDLSLGLPAEINARRRQYHYYRDRLLAFEEVAA